MKKLLLIPLMIIALAFSALAYSSGIIQAEDGISGTCTDSGVGCIHWQDESMTFGSASCTTVDNTCTVGSNAWFVINDTPATVPAGYICNITVALNLTGTASEDLTVRVNGGSASTITDAYPPGNYEVQFPDSFTFIGGSDGSDLINFSGANSAVKFDYFILECSEPPAVPEFSTLTLGLGLIAVLGGIFIIRKIR